MLNFSDLRQKVTFQIKCIRQSWANFRGLSDIGSVVPLWTGHLSGIYFKDHVQKIVALGEVHPPVARSRVPRPFPPPSPIPLCGKGANVAPERDASHPPLDGRYLGVGYHSRLVRCSPPLSGQYRKWGPLLHHMVFFSFARLAIQDNAKQAKLPKAKRAN